MASSKERDEALLRLMNYGSYDSQYQPQIDTLYNDIMNRKEFSYDLNGDALYKQMRDQYVKQGKMAMMDTVGQASALTGGYGNSWATTAGSQAYQGHLTGLNDKVPELYAMALDNYNRKGTDMMNQLTMLQNMDESAYNRWLGGYNMAQDAYNLAEQRYQNDVANEQWAQEYALKLAKQQAAQREAAMKKAKQEDPKTYKVDQTQPDAVVARGLADDKAGMNYKAADDYIRAGNMEGAVSVLIAQGYNDYQIQSILAQRKKELGV